MKREYVAPALALVGKASEIVRGLGDVGADYLGQIMIPEMEFECDDSPGE